MLSSAGLRKQPLASQRSPSRTSFQRFIAHQRCCGGVLASEYRSKTARTQWFIPTQAVGTSASEELSQPQRSDDRGSELPRVVVQVEHPSSISISREAHWKLLQELTPEEHWKKTAVVLACLESIYRAEYLQYGQAAVAALQAANTYALPEPTPEPWKFEFKLPAGKPRPKQARKKRKRKKRSPSGRVIDNYTPTLLEQLATASLIAGAKLTRRNRSTQDASDPNSTTIGTAADAGAIGVASGLSSSTDSTDNSHVDSTALPGPLQRLDPETPEQIAARLDADLAALFTLLIQSSHFQPLTHRDVEVAKSLNRDYLSQLFIAGDMKKMDSSLVTSMKASGVYSKGGQELSLEPASSTVDSDQATTSSDHSLDDEESSESIDENGSRGRTWSEWLQSLRDADQQLSKTSPGSFDWAKPFATSRSTATPSTESAAGAVDSMSSPPTYAMPNKQAGAQDDAQALEERKRIEEDVLKWADWSSVHAHAPPAPTGTAKADTEQQGTGNGNATATGTAGSEVNILDDNWMMTTDSYDEEECVSDASGVDTDTDTDETQQHIATALNSSRSHQQRIGNRLAEECQSLLLFKRDWGEEVSRGRLFVQKLDYLQTLAVTVVLDSIRETALSAARTVVTTMESALVTVTDLEASSKVDSVSAAPQAAVSDLQTMGRLSQPQDSETRAKGAPVSASGPPGDAVLVEAGKLQQTQCVPPQPAPDARLKSPGSSSIISPDIEAQRDDAAPSLTSSPYDPEQSCVMDMPASAAAHHHGTSSESDDGEGQHRKAGAVHEGSEITNGNDTTGAGQDSIVPYIPASPGTDTQPSSSSSSGSQTLLSDSLNGTTGDALPVGRRKKKGKQHRAKRQLKTSGSDVPRAPAVVNNISQGISHHAEKRKNADAVVAAYDAAVVNGTSTVTMTVDDSYYMDEQLGGQSAMSTAAQPVEVQQSNAQQVINTTASTNGKGVVQNSSTSGDITGMSASTNASQENGTNLIREASRASAASTITANIAQDQEYEKGNLKMNGTGTTATQGSAVTAADTSTQTLLTINANSQATNGNSAVTHSGVDNRFAQAGTLQETSAGEEARAHRTRRRVDTREWPESRASRWTLDSEPDVWVSPGVRLPEHHWGSSVSAAARRLARWLSEAGLGPRLDVLPLAELQRRLPVIEPPRLQPLLLPKVALAEVFGPRPFSEPVAALLGLLLQPVQLQQPTLKEFAVLYRRLPKQPRNQAGLLRSVRAAAQKVGLVKGKGASTPARPRPPIHIRIYRDLPLATWQLALPDKLLQFRPLDLLRADLFALTGLVALLAQAKYESLILDIITVISATVFIVRIALGFKRMDDRYRNQVAEVLREKTVATDGPALEFLAAQAALQQFKQASLAYIYALQQQGWQDAATADSTTTTNTRSSAIARSDVTSDWANRPQDRVQDDDGVSTAGTAVHTNVASTLPGPGNAPATNNNIKQMTLGDGSAAVDNQVQSGLNIIATSNNNSSSSNTSRGYYSTERGFGPSVSADMMMAVGMSSSDDVYLDGDGQTAPLNALQFGDDDSWSRNMQSGDDVDDGQSSRLVLGVSASQLAQDVEKLLATNCNIKVRFDADEAISELLRLGLADVITHHTQQGNAGLAAPSRSVAATPPPTRAASSKQLSLDDAAQPLDVSLKDVMAMAEATSPSSGVAKTEDKAASTHASTSRKENGTVQEVQGVEGVTTGRRTHDGVGDGTDMTYRVVNTTHAMRLVQQHWDGLLWQRVDGILREFD